MSATLSPEGAEFVANLTAIPWQVYATLAAITIGGYLLARWSDGYTHMTDEYVAARKAEERQHLAELSRLDLLDAGFCGAVGPHRTICARPAGHDGDHVDPFTGTRYHSARWGGAA